MVTDRPDTEVNPTVTFFGALDSQVASFGTSGLKVTKNLKFLIGSVSRVERLLIIVGNLTP